MKTKIMIGLETHVQLNTKSKMFCSCATKGSDEPNTRVCEICMGAPGSKPAINKEVINKALSIALALNCNISKHMSWDRKSYFYPDMGKNYQITQYDDPLGRNGEININGNNIRIRRVHMEEDPARLVHIGGSIRNSNYVLVDYNRSGIPLVEIVTEPDMKSPEQAREYLTQLTSILEHLGVFEPGDFTLKSDCNISINGGARVEIKNVNGIKAVEQALKYELMRQQNLVKRGQKVTRGTRQYDPITNTTHALRSKEAEKDYGYIVDTDLPVLELTNEQINNVKKSLPELPEGRIKRFVKIYKLSENQARSLVSDKALADFFEECVKDYKNPLRVASWINTQLLKCLNYNKETIRTSKVTPKLFMEFMGLMDNKVITERFGKELIKEFVSSGKSPTLLVREKNYTIISKEKLLSVIKKVLTKNKETIEVIKKGNNKAINYLIGQVLKEIKGQGDPNEIRELILKNI